MRVKMKIIIFLLLILGIGLVSSSLAYGLLSVNLTLPLNNTEITANTTFSLTANVTCLNANCGIVRGLARL